MAEAGKEETAEEFSQRLNVIVTHSFVSLAISLGAKSGLFDALVKLHEKESTAQDIADAAGLKERYVREWLGVMVCAKIVDINPETEQYRLPAHRVPYFKTGAMASDLMTLTTAVPMLTAVHHKLLECLKKDGPTGLPYSDYIDFHSFMASLSSRWTNNNLVQVFLPSLPKIEQQLKSGIKVLDLGCGQGSSTIIFAENYPNSSIVGLDFSEDCINFGREVAKKKNLTNVEFICCDAAEMPSDWTGKFDYVYVFDVIHDLAHADRVLKEVNRILSPSGVFSMIDPDCRTKQSDNVELLQRARLYAISLFHCLPVSLFFEGSVGLGTAWGREKATQYLRDAGLEVDSITRPANSVQAHYMCSKAR